MRGTETHRHWLLLRRLLGYTRSIPLEAFADIKEEVGVHWRTIKRDLAALVRQQMGVKRYIKHNRVFWVLDREVFLEPTRLIAPQMKVCVECKGKPQPISSFTRFVYSLDGYNNVCKRCAAKYRKLLYKKNPVHRGRVRQQARKWWQRNKTRVNEQRRIARNRKGSDKSQRKASVPKTTKQED